MTYEVVSILVFELFALFSHGRTDGRTERQNRVIEGAPLLKKKRKNKRERKKLKIKSKTLILHYVTF